MVMSYTRGSSGSKSRLQQVFDAFDSLGFLVKDWEYDNSSWNRFRVDLDEGDYDQLVSMGFLQADSIAANCPMVGPLAGPCAGTRGIVTVGMGLTALYNLVQGWMQARNQPGIRKPNSGIPTGTKGINEMGWDKEKVHAVKEGIGAKAPDWVGVDLDGNVWTGSPSGEAVNHGPWR